MIIKGKTDHSLEIFNDNGRIFFIITQGDRELSFSIKGDQIQEVVDYLKKNED